MDWLYLSGRILYAMIFVGSGIGHFVQLEGMSRYAASKGLPAPKILVLTSGVAILSGGLSVMLGIWMEIGTWLLFIFLTTSALTIHTFWTLTDPPQKIVEQAIFMRNLSMAGAALMLYWLVQTYGYGPFAVGRPL